MKKRVKFVDIVGARPQFIKLAPVLKAIEKHNMVDPDIYIDEVLIHTGQHYDYEMSGVFFDELGLKSPDYHLGVGSGTHGSQTGEMLKKIETVLIKEEPELVIVYGDTNSTLAGALAAAKLHIPVAHVEAGLRSFNRKMPEEINRILTDHVSEFLFCPTETAVENLRNEGFTNILNDGKLFHIHYDLSELSYSSPVVINTGDVMFDAALMYLNLAEQKSRIIEDLNLRPKCYALATIHRAENTNDPEKLKTIFAGLEAIAKNELPVILPAHPRTRKEANVLGISPNRLKVINPVSYMDMLLLEKYAKVILTDSGGVQKEAFFFRVPCVTLRNETEWVETVELGWNVLLSSSDESLFSKIPFAKKDYLDNCPYGDGQAAKRIINFLKGDKTLSGSINNK